MTAASRLGMGLGLGTSTLARAQQLINLVLCFSNAGVSLRPRLVPLARCAGDFEFGSARSLLTGGRSDCLPPPSRCITGALPTYA